MMNDMASGKGADKTTLNISITADDKKFLKVYAAQNETTVSHVIQNYIAALKHAQADTEKEPPEKERG